jgi:hypothetical protein
LATLGALGACFSGAIFLTEERASVDILIALVSGGLSYSSITLCVSSLVTTINKLGSGDPQINSGRIGKCIVSLIVMIVFLIIISIVYSKIISKVLTTQVVSILYLSLSVVFFVVTLGCSYLVMRTFEEGGA